MKAKSIKGNSPEEIKSTLVAAAVFGLDVTVLGLFFLILIPYVFLEHTNIRFPGWIDKTIGLIFTTPNIHKVHHERDQYYTDSNYSDIFIIWDRIFGTFKYKPPGEINLGLMNSQTIASKLSGIYSSAHLSIWAGLVLKHLKKK